jgi:hypothetical protein
MVLRVGPVDVLPGSAAGVETRFAIAVGTAVDAVVLVAEDASVLIGEAIPAVLAGCL